MLDDLLFLLWSQALGSPWSPEPWLRAKQRKAFSIVMAERKVAEIMARIAVLESLKLELVEACDELDEWAERVHWYALAAERLEKLSAWYSPPEVGDPELEARSRNWVWSDARGRYVHVDVELEEEEATDGE